MIEAPRQPPAPPALSWSKGCPVLLARRLAPNKVALEKLPEIDQVGLYDRAEQETRSAYDRGVIGRETLRGTLGSGEGDLRPDPSRSSGAADPAARGQSAPTDGRELDQPAQADFAAPTQEQRRIALERQGAGRLKGQAAQKPPGSDGGLFDSGARDVELFDLDDGKGPRTAADIDAELKAGEQGIAAIKGCLL